MDLFVKVDNGSYQLTTFTESSILGVWESSECGFEVISDKKWYKYGMEDFQ